MRASRHDPSGVGWFSRAPDFRVKVADDYCAVECPFCTAQPGEDCHTALGYDREPHKLRKERWLDMSDDAPRLSRYFDDYAYYDEEGRLLLPAVDPLYDAEDDPPLAPPVDDLMGGLCTY